MKFIVINSIRLYRFIFSPDTGLLRGLYGSHIGCALYPSCSQYTILAIEKYGVWRGVIRGVLRIGRCHSKQKNVIDFP